MAYRPGVGAEKTWRFGCLHTFVYSDLDICPATLNANNRSVMKGDRTAENNTTF